MEIQERGFRGLRVVSFESRQSDQMIDLITRNGGQPIAAPSMREVPLEQNVEALAFGEKLMRGEIDILVFLTGVGMKTLLEVLETRWARPAIVEALRKIKLVTRGPKPLALFRELGLTPATTVPEPNTWRELLATLNEKLSIAGKTLALQEYGMTSKELIQGLVSLRAKVLRVPVYRWALPEDTEPLRRALHQVVNGEVDVVLFTNATQINNVLQIAQAEGIEKNFREALSRMVVASVGPVCTQFLDEYGLPVDIEPEHPKMGNLVLEASRKAGGILAKKRLSPPPLWGRTEVGGAPHPNLPPQVGKELADSLFMKACRRESTDRTPIWLMRQAGRYMKEYRDVRDRHSFLDLCKDADLATEVTVYAVERLGVDAAIIFSDILLILEPLGLTLEYAKGDGPVIHNPVRTPGDIDRLRPLTDMGPLSFLPEAIAQTRKSLPSGIPLIGFSGAPFTLASYMIEGQGSRNYVRTKGMMYDAPEAWNRLMKTLSDSLIVYLNAQIAAGAQAVQLFDSWVGCLSLEDYRAYVLPHTRRVIQHIAKGVPVIHFGTQTGTLLELMRDAGGDVIGIDWRVELDAAWKRLGYSVALQGNLDPAALFAEPAEIRQRAKRILDQAGGRPGHIFNLGHGVLPDTPVGHVKALVDAVREFSAR